LRHGCSFDFPALRLKCGAAERRISDERNAGCPETGRKRLGATIAASTSRAGASPWRCRFPAASIAEWMSGERSPTRQRDRESVKEILMAYVDGFVAAVPTANREKYRKHAEDAAVVFKDHGALKVVECWGDDVPDGKVTSFQMAVKRKDDETVVFSWVVWPSRKVRDEGMKNVMADPRVQPDVSPMPFDGQRLIYGGFEAIVDA
jgi:uncharacterized protein YbaA (DUF1428 family)